MIIMCVREQELGQLSDILLVLGETPLLGSLLDDTYELANHFRKSLYNIRKEDFFLWVYPHTQSGKHTYTFASLVFPWFMEQISSFLGTFSIFREGNAI